MEVYEINHVEAKKENDFQNKNRNLGDDMKMNSDGNVVLTKQAHEQDEPHCGDTSDFVAENGDEEDNFNQMFECQVDEAAECNSDVQENKS
ncbi:hypothetical protein RDI58_024228 [Solanum bulbocastanum]|uniref:Uncharacterized protein n=1 Tax=Solanum bulbocastanum TaxID=147425 RepID=A0AAN8T2M4_SOLBU